MMASWNDLPKELKWLIIEHLIIERTSYFHNRQDYRCCWYFSGYGNFLHEGTKVIPSELAMSELLVILSLIDKQTRKLLQSKTRVSKTRVFFKTSLDNVNHLVFKIIS